MKKLLKKYGYTKYTNLYMSVIYKSIVEGGHEEIQVFKSNYDGFDVCHSNGYKIIDVRKAETLEDALKLGNGMFDAIKITKEAV